MYPSSGLLPARTLLPGLTSAATLYTYWANFNEIWESNSLVKVSSGLIRIGHCGYVTPDEVNILSPVCDIRLGASNWTRTDFNYPFASEEIDL